MKYFAPLLLLTVFSCQKNVSNAINLKKENYSFEVNDTIYFVGKDLKNISAKTGNQLIWQRKIISDSLKEFKNFVGKPEIRSVEYDQKSSTIFVVFGKHSCYKLKTKNGEIVASGSD